MAGKVETLWFIAGLTTGVLGSLIVGMGYMTDIAQHATDAKKSVPRPPPPSQELIPPWVQRLVSSERVTIARDEMLLIRGIGSIAVLKFDANEASSADYHWRSLAQGAGTVVAGSGRVVQGTGKDFVQTLELGHVSVDWLGRAAAGTALYYQPPTTVERRPGADFDSIDLAAELSLKAL